MKNDGKHDQEDSEGLEPHADAALWNLLGQGANPGARPYFASRVLREVALGEEGAGEPARTRWWQAGALQGVCRKLGRIALYASSPAAALFLLFLGLHPAGHRTPGRRLPVAVEVLAAGNDPAAPATQDSAPTSGGDVALNNALLPDDVSAQDVEVIADLDNLLKREESRLWTEDTARF